MPEVDKGTVLLLGARSFIGGHVCRALVRNGYRVLIHSTKTEEYKNLHDFLPHPQVGVLKCAYSESDKLKDFMSRAQFLIYSAVAPAKQTLGEGWARARDYRDFQNIMRILVNCPNIQKSVFLSTCSTIGRVDGLADENCIAPKPHGWAGLKLKFKLEKLVMDYIQRGLKITIVNPSMCVGEYDARPSSGEFFKFIVKVPFMVLKGFKINIVDVEAAAQGVVNALERGRVGERYILGGANIYFDDLFAYVKKLAGKPMPKVIVPVPVTIIVSVLTEIVNIFLRRPKPLIPLVGIELKKFGNQHFSCEKAQRELGYDPRDAWAAVERGFKWYKEHGII